MRRERESMDNSREIKRQLRQDKLASLCYLAPSFLGVAVFFILPFGVVVYYSMIDGVASKTSSFSTILKSCSRTAPSAWRRPTR